jgi:hypothetical protein
MALKVGRKLFPFPGAVEASRVYCATIERLGVGGSKAPRCLIIDGKTIVGHVSYNGKVWAGAQYVPGAPPVYNPYAAQ